MLDGSGAFIADIEEKKDSPSAPDDSDSDEENPYIGCCRRDADIEGEPMIGCDSADCNQWWHKCCLGFGDKEDAWMELTSNAFYFCTPGCKSVAEELREQERTEEKEEAKEARSKRKETSK